MLRPALNRMITRRNALRTAAAATLAAPTILQAATPAAPAPAAAAPTGPHRLEPLPYPVDALEPFIDARTMEIHHGRHHAAYVTGLNKVVHDHPDLAGKTPLQLISNIAGLPETARTAVRNHGGGHVNHAFFWQILKRNGGIGPSGPLMEALVRRFGTFDAFKAEFTKASLSVFGSGWAWLSRDKSGEIGIETTANQDSPHMGGRVPLVGLDVWEHAYYLKYQNKRVDYVNAFFNVIHWEAVSQIYAKPA